MRELRKAQLFLLVFLFYSFGKESMKAHGEVTEESH